MGLKLAHGQKPVAVKTHWNYKIPDYDLYEIAEAVPNVVSEKQKAALEKAKAASLAKRTCTRCGWVEDLSRNYRSKWYIRGGLCPACWEEDRIKGDKNEASLWARDIFKRDDVLILDTETTGFDGEVIELAIINLKRETVLNQRFNPLSEVSAGAKAVHGIGAEMLVNEPRFAECAPDVLRLLTSAGLVLIYNADFDLGRLRHTCKLHGVEMPEINTDCIMERYAQWYGEWSEYHGSYKWQPLGGGHDALGDCLAALDYLHDMAGLE